MKTKLVVLMSLFVLFFACAGIVYAEENLISTNTAQDVFSFGKVYNNENSAIVTDSNAFNLPYCLISNEDVLVKASINRIGAIFAQRDIVVDNGISKPTLIIGAKNVQINGVIDSGIIISEKVTIYGTISKDVIIMATEFIVEEDAVIGGDVICLASKANIKGRLSENMIGAIEKLSISGSVAKDIRVSVSDIYLYDMNADSLGGNIYIESEESQLIPTHLLNKTKQYRVVGEQNDNSKQFPIIGLFQLIGTYFVMLLIMPRFVDNIINYTKPSIGRIIGNGALLIFVLPVVLFISFIAFMFFLPVTFIGFALYISAIYISNVVTGVALSRYAREKYKVMNVNKTMTVIFDILGIVILSVVSLIPFGVGAIIKLLTVIFGAGIITEAIIRSRKKETKETGEDDKEKNAENVTL